MVCASEGTCIGKSSLILFVCLAIKVGSASLDVDSCLSVTDDGRGAGLLQANHQAFAKKRVFNSSHEGFLNLYTLLVTPRPAWDVSRRRFDYCYVLSRNANAGAVISINLFTQLTETDALNRLAECHLGEAQNKISLHPDYKDDELTYKLLFEEANKEVSGNALQVVLNADIEVADWSPVREVLGTMHSNKISLHLPWNGEVSTLRSRCNHDIGSYDTVAFNHEIDAATLQMMNFQPNHLGAENMVVCNLQRAGWKTLNVCGELPTYHVHANENSRWYAGERMNTKSGDGSSVFECDPTNSSRTWNAAHAFLKEIN